MTLPPLAGGRPNIASIAGRYVRLEALQPEKHTDGLWEIAGGNQHAHLWQYMPEGPFEDREQFRQAVAHAAGQDDPVFFVILDQATGAVEGRCALLNIRPTHRVMEVGHILFSTRFQRTRGGTEAFYLLAKYVFEELACRRYEWKCNALNAKSRSAALRLGFQFEGIFRQHMIVKGLNRDTAWFSMLDSEWPGIKAATEAWLTPENFDAQGRQRQPLGVFVG